jgi:hypothetical protein
VHWERVISIGEFRNSKNVRKSDNVSVLQVTRLRYRHPVEKNFLKTIYTISTPRGIPKRSFVSYEWHCDPYEVFGLPHGNARYTVDSYQPAMASEREVGTATEVRSNRHTRPAAHRFLIGGSLNKWVQEG